MTCPSDDLATVAKHVCPEEVTTDVAAGGISTIIQVLLRNLPLLVASPAMANINFLYRDCTIDIEIHEHTNSWDITIEISPRDGVALMQPFDTKTLKLPKSEAFEVIQNALVEETKFAVDYRLVGAG